MINRVSRVALMKMLRCASRPLGNVSYSTSLSSATLQMPPCDFQPEAYNGIHYEDALRIRKQNVSPAVFTFYRKPVMVHQGYMQWLWDVTGKRYLDLFAGIVTISVGHCHPKVVNVAERQLKRLWHTTNIYMHSALHEYAEKLVSKLPEDLKVVYFTNSGSEANDLALFMARMHTGTFDAVSPRNAYHGASPYVMGLTALSTWRYNVPTGFGIHQTMNPDPFRGPWGGANCRDSPVQGKEAGGILPISSGKGVPEFGEFIQKRKGNYLVAGHQIKTIRSCDCKEGQCIASDMYIQQLEDVLQFSAPKGKVAAFFAESIQGVGGTVQFPKGYLKGAFEKVRERGGLCISDEVQTGFGRTGTHFWGFESHDVVPDIVTMAKGMGNGFPLGAVVTSSKIASLMGNALHFNTFGGNPMACTIGSAVLDVVEKEKVQENSHTIGTYFLLELAKLRDEFEVIGDVRGKGLMIGVELVTDKESRKPLPAEHVAEIWERTKDLGILVGKGGLYSNVFRIKPPMCITKEDVDFSLDVLRKSLAGYENPVIA